MYSLILENSAGRQIELTNRTEYQVMEISGLSPPGAVINTSATAHQDGARFSSSKTKMRSMNISLAINKEAEKNRIDLYDVIRTGEQITVHYKNSRRDVSITGYVESFDILFFGQKQTAAVAILCPQPYFRAAQDVINDVNLIIGAFHFPFAIEEAAPVPLSYYGEIAEINIVNIGDITSGMQIEIRASGQVENPRIYNRDTREFFGVKGEFKSGDVIYIDTRKGSKKVRLLRDGEYTNIFNSIERDSTWLDLKTGDNIFTYEGDGSSAEYMNIRFIHSLLYKGV